MSGPYSRLWPLPYPDADPTGDLRLTSLLHTLQTQAGDHSQSLGFDYREHYARGEFWVLSRLALQAEGWPRWPAPYEVQTWLRGTKALFALREYRWRPEGGPWLGRACAAWVLLKNRRPQRPEAWVTSAVAEAPEAPWLDVPDALPPWTPGPAAFTADLEADWESLDLNHHVNQVYPVGWCLARHGYEFLMTHKPVGLTVNYLAEMFAGQRYRVEGGEEAGGTGSRRFEYRVSRVEDGTVTLRLQALWAPSADA